MSPIKTPQKRQTYSARKIFKKYDSRNLNMSLSKNASYNMLGSGLPLALSIITIPLYLRFVGEARYGIMALVWILLGYFSLFDLGLGRAAAQKIASQGDQPIDDRAKTFWTASIISLGLGLAGGIVIWPVGSYWFDGVMQLPEGLREEIRAAVPLLIVAVPIGALTGVMNGALQGRDRFLEINLISIANSVLSQIAPLAVAAAFGATLSNLIAIVILVRLVTLGLLIRACRRFVFGGLRPSFDKGAAMTLIQFGGWVTVSALIGPLMVVFDRFVIGALLGPEYVSYYTIAFQLSEAVTIAAAALTAAMFPKFVIASSHERSRLAYGGMSAIIAVITPIVCCGIMILGPFLRWWLGPSFYENAVFPGQVLLIAFWLNSLARIPLSLLHAQGRPDIVGRCHLGEVVPYLLCLYVALKEFGLIGAAIAFLSRVAADLLIMTALAGLLKDTIKIMIIPIALLSFSLFVSQKVVGNGTLWVISGAVVLTLSVTWGWRAAPLQLRDMVIAFRKRLLWR